MEDFWRHHDPIGAGTLPGLSSQGGGARRGPLLHGSDRGVCRLTSWIALWYGLLSYFFCCFYVLRCAEHLAVCAHECPLSHEMVPIPIRSVGCSLSVPAACSCCFCSFVSTAAVLLRVTTPSQTSYRFVLVWASLGEPLAGLCKIPQIVTFRGSCPPAMTFN